MVAFDAEYDREMLESSYNAIHHKDSLEFMIGDSEREIILQKVTATLTIPANASLSFQNLFRLTLSNGQFYIAQCLLNYGFSASSRSASFTEHKYYFQTVGIADIKIDLGNTLFRRETKTDKIIGRFFGNDIDFEGTKEFNEKYYLVSDMKEAVVNCCDKNFLNTIAKYDDIVLTTKGKEMFITFDTDFEEKQSRIVEDIFGKCKFLLA
ncbi:MAG: hypothetical protein WDO71_15305 [Bacteroidota bacterium]